MIDAVNEMYVEKKNVNTFVADVWFLQWKCLDVYCPYFEIQRIGNLTFSVTSMNNNWICWMTQYPVWQVTLAWMPWDENCWRQIFRTVAVISINCAIQKTKIYILRFIMFYYHIHCICLSCNVFNSHKCKLFLRRYLSLPYYGSAEGPREV